MNNDKLECIFCNGNLIIDNKCFKCQNCGEEFDIFSEIPCLYKYTREDVLGLIEIIANKERLGDHNVFDLCNLKKWFNLLNEGLVVKNHEDYINNSPDWAKPWLEDRFREHYIFSKLSEGINLENKDVLDVGAGLGFDSYRLVANGANVTALEFSPFLAKLGKQALPMINWICGSASHLPFKNKSFDYIFCNAALHHVANVGKTMNEMLRVLKPGGAIFTIGDSYRSVNVPRDMELEIFNEHEGVLSGINESIIDIEIMVRLFDKFREKLDVEVISHISNSHLNNNSPIVKMFDKNKFVRLNFYKNKKAIERNFDGLSFGIKLRSAIDVGNFSKLSKSEIIPNSDSYMKSISNNNFMVELAQFIPNKYLDLDLRSFFHEKFCLLNGLQRPVRVYPWRKAYKRLRLFFSSRKKVNYSLKSCDSETHKITITINGEFFLDFYLTSKWMPINIEMPTTTKKSIVEFRLEQNGLCPPFFLISSMNFRLLNIFYENRMMKWIFLNIMKIKNYRIYGIINKILPFNNIKNL